MTGAPPTAWLQTRASELWPLSRVRACGANWVAVEHRLALAGVSRQCRRQHIGVMVWTVNSEREMRYWLAGHRADLIITDRPALAIGLPSRAEWPAHRNRLDLLAAARARWDAWMRNCAPNS